jgi:lipoate-protein ligase A
MKVRWINAGKVDHLRSQSIYHGLGYSFSTETPNTIVLAIPERPYICVGYFQDPTKELDLDYCSLNQLPIIRRQTGGGAVYIDNQQLFVQWIFNPESVPQKVEQKFQNFVDPMIETYKFFGIDAYSYGGHDVHVDGRKIVGTGAARIGEAEVITGNFIKDFDCTHMVGALNLPKDSMRNQVRTGMNEFITSLNSELEITPSFDEISEVYRRKCEQMGFEIFEDDFTDQEWSYVIDQEAKLASDQWTFEIKQKENDSRLIKINTAVWVAHTQYRAGNKTVEITLKTEENVLDYLSIGIDNKGPNESTRLVESHLLNTLLTANEVKRNLDHCFEKYDEKQLYLTKSEWGEAFMKIEKAKRKISGGG